MTKEENDRGFHLGHLTLNNNPGTMTKEDNDQGLIKLASVDCSGDMGNKLCSQYRVDAFPTIMVFRRSKTLDFSTATLHPQTDHSHSLKGLNSLGGWKPLAKTSVLELKPKFSIPESLDPDPIP